MSWLFAAGIYISIPIAARDAVFAKHTMAHVATEDLLCLWRHADAH